MRATGLCVLAAIVSVATVFAQKSDPASVSASGPDAVSPVDSVADDAEPKSRSLLSDKPNAVRVEVIDGGQLLVTSGDPESIKRLEEVLKLLQQGRLDEARDAQRQAKQIVAQATAQAKKGGRADLERLVREDFTFRQKTQMAEIKLLKQRLESLERRVQQQDKLKEELIRQRVQMLLSTPSEPADPFGSMMGRESGKAATQKPITALAQPRNEGVKPVAPTTARMNPAGMHPFVNPDEHVLMRPRMRTASEYVQWFAGLQQEIDAHEEKIPGDSTRKAHLQRLDGFKAQYAALERELEYHLSVIRSSMKAAGVDREVSREKLMHAKRLYSNGAMAKSELDAAQVSVAKADAKFEQLEQLAALYQEVVPKTAAERQPGSIDDVRRPATKRLKLELPQPVVEIRLKQRNEKVIPGSDSQLWVHMGDVTAGQAFVSVRTEDHAVLLDEASLEEGQTASFKVNGVRFFVRMKDLRNVLIGEDFGTVQIAADRADFRPMNEFDDEPGRAGPDEEESVDDDTEPATDQTTKRQVSSQPNAGR